MNGMMQEIKARMCDRGIEVVSDSTIIHFILSVHLLSYKQCQMSFGINGVSSLREREKNIDRSSVL